MERRIDRVRRGFRTSGLRAAVLLGLAFVIAATPSCGKRKKKASATTEGLTGGVLVFGREVSPAHPTQLYEALASLVGAWLALSLLRRCGGDGNAFLAFVAWYSGFRLLNHFLRVPGAGLVVPDLFYPAVYGGVALVSLTMLLVRNSGPARLESRL